MKSADPPVGDASFPQREELLALRERVAALEAEKAANAATASTAEIAATEPESSARSSRGVWRAWLSAVLIVLATLLTPVSVVGAWARAELVDTEKFVAAFAPLIDDADVQALVIDQVTAAVDEQLDIAGLTDALFDGIATLDLPPRAQQALQLLRIPAAQGAQSLVDQTVARVVQSDAFADVWEAALRASHRALEVAATGGGEGGVLSIDDRGVVGIELGPVIEEVKKRLVDRGMSFASAIPAVDRTIVIVQSDALVTVRLVYGVAVVAGWWLPVLTLVLFVAGILVARRRSAALLGAGLGLALGAGTLATTLAVGDTVMGIAANQIGVPSPALGSVYAQVIGAMRQTALVLVVIGIVVAVFAWTQGRWRGAIATRRAVDGTTAAARGFLAERGVHTGRFGAWMDTNRVLVRAVIAVLAVVWLWLLRPLGAGDVFLVVIVALLVWWVCELVRGPHDPAAD